MVSPLFGGDFQNRLCGVLGSPLGGILDGDASGALRASGGHNAVRGDRGPGSSPGGHGVLQQACGRGRHQFAVFHDQLGIHGGSATGGHAHHAADHGNPGHLVAFLVGNQHHVGGSAHAAAGVALGGDHVGVLIDGAASDGGGIVVGLVSGGVGPFGVQIQAGHDQVGPAPAGALVLAGHVLVYGDLRGEVDDAAIKGAAHHAHLSCGLPGEVPHLVALAALSGEAGNGAGGGVNGIRNAAHRVGGSRAHLLHVAENGLKALPTRKMAAVYSLTERWQILKQLIS